MSRVLPTAVALAVALVAVTGGYAGFTAYSHEQEIQQLTDTRRAEVKNLMEARSERDAAVEARDAVKATHDAQAAVLVERETFVAAVKNTADAFTSAEGKVDVTAEKDRVLAAQAVVAAEKRDAGAVNAQTQAVQQVAAEVAEKVSAHDARVAAERAAAEAAAKKRGQAPPRSSGGSGSSTGGNWLAGMQSRMNSYGGGFVTVSEYDGNCGGVQAAACNYGINTVMVHHSLASKSESFIHWVLKHELAHSYQRMVWDTIHASPTFAKLYNSNIEVLANCMSYAKGAPRHGHKCSDEMVNWAANIWNGHVPS